MSEDKQSLDIKRVLVAVDASPHSLAALEAAVDLAARFKAELAGLFVEDENLMRLADLPFVQEIGIFTATRRRINGEEMERQTRITGRHVRQVFTTTLQQAQITWSFRVVRGAIIQEVLSASYDADMIVLGKAGWSLIRRGKLGSTVRGILPERFGLALILKEGTCLGKTVAVVHDGSAVADRALIAADTLRQKMDSNRPLIILLLAADPKETQALQEQIESQFSNTRFRFLTGANALYLTDIFMVINCGLLVLPASSSSLQNNKLIELLENLDLPVLLVT